MDKEYIERETVMHIFKEGFKYEEPMMFEWANSRISSIPAADVEPVRHGVWIERSDKGILNMRCPYMCNICGRVEAVKEPYCNCGARMDGATPFEEIKTGLQQAINYEKDISNGGNSDV